MDKQNNNNQITLPRRSRRLATIIPASHWIDMGYSEDDAQLMEKLQNDMKNYCDSSDTDINLHGRNGVGALNHHELMIPHWNKLLKALKGRTNVEFGITSVSLSTSLLDVVFPALQLVNIVELTLFGCGLGDEGFQCLSFFLGNNSSVKSLGVGADQIDNWLVARALSGAIKDHPSLEEIFVANCVGHNTRNLSTILLGCTTKKRLIITMEYFSAYGPQGIDVLANFICSNHSFESLQLKDNDITNDDAKLLAVALKHNALLKELDVRENDDITEEGEKALLKAMFDSTSMDSIVNSNHVCKDMHKTNMSTVEKGRGGRLVVELYKICSNSLYLWD